MAQMRNYKIVYLILINDSPISTTQHVKCNYRYFSILLNCLSLRANLIYFNCMLMPLMTD